MTLEFGVERQVFEDGTHEKSREMTMDTPYNRYRCVFGFQSGILGATDWNVIYNTDSAHRFMFLSNFDSPSPAGCGDRGPTLFSFSFRSAIESVYTDEIFYSLETTDSKLQNPPVDVFPDSKYPYLL
jgi:hypothetical protein